MRSASSNALQSATGMSKSDLDWCKAYWKGKQQKPSEVAVVHSQPATAEQLKQITELRQRLADQPYCADDANGHKLDRPRPCF